MDEEVARLVEQARHSRERLLASSIDVKDALNWCQSHAGIIDGLLAGLFEIMGTRYPDAPPMSLAATGGYGRRELCPWSDVDLSLVPLQDDTPGMSDPVRWLFRSTSDAIQVGLGLRVGYSFRSVSDVPGFDATTISSLFDARLVAGAPEPLEVLSNSIIDGLPTADFIIDKLQERRRDVAKTHDTPLVAEPHLKLGAGGLRSTHVSDWINIALGGHPLPRSDSYLAVLRARTLLHLVTARCHDELTRARATEIAERIGSTPLQFSSDLVASMLQNQHALEMTIKRLGLERYPVNSAVMADHGVAHVQVGSDAGKAAIGVRLAISLGLEVSEDLPTVSTSIGPEALAAISGGEATVRSLDRSGLLDLLLPEFTGCRVLMPEDASHRFTVYEHTLRAVRLLDSILPETPLGTIKASLDDESSLRLALLLHDTGKALPGKPHSETGAAIARDVAKRWRLESGITELASWLVSEHLTMSRFIRMRDVMHPDTAVEFAAVVGDKERLDNLTLLTYADMAAVNEDLWTPVQETFLIELHARTSQVLSAESRPATDVTAARRRMLRRLQSEAVPGERLSAFLDSLPPHYVLSTDPQSVTHHFWAAEEARDGDPQVIWDDKADIGLTDVAVVCLDRPGLLQSILAVLYAYDLSLSGLRAGTTTTDRPVAVDVFNVSSGGRCVNRRVAAVIEADLVAVITGVKTPDEVLRARDKDPDRSQELLTVSYLEGPPGIIEVRAPRGRGMPFRVSRTISKQGWNVLAARVGQWAGSGTAAFYVEGADADQVARAFQTQKV